MTFDVSTIGLTGSVKLASGTIASPVALVDLALPTGYASFKLEICNLKFSTTENLCIAFSADGGATFLNDAVHQDSYISSGFVIKSDGTLSAYGLPTVDGLADFGNSQDPASNVGFLAVLHLFPGSANEFAQFICQQTSYGTAFSVAGYTYGAANMAVNPDATVTPTPQRINLIRLLPYGNDDCNPPTSGNTIIRMTYALWGITP